MQPASLCHATTKTGKPCLARPAAGKDFCLVHDPSRAELVHQMQVKAGKKRQEITSSIRNFQLRDSRDLKAGLAFTIETIMRKKVKTQLELKLLPSLSREYMKAEIRSGLLERVEELEAAVRGRED